jgi:transposase
MCYSRHGRKGTLQIVYGLLCAPDGCPVAIEVFDGNTGHPKTLASQVEKLKRRFGLDHVVLVGDRGMITQARLTAVARKRNPLRGASEIALAVGAVIEKHKIRKHFDLTITDTKLTFARKTDAIAEEAATDGIYIVRTSLAAEVLDDAATVRSYKSLSQVERAFRCIKTVDLQVRPVHHWLADRVRAHVFLCMLAYYLEWHMRQKLAPLLFDDTDKDAAEAARESVVAKAQRSPSATRKQTTGITPDGLPGHSFRTLLADLATLARNTIVTAVAPNLPLTVFTRPTPVQQRAIDLLEVASTGFCIMRRSSPSKATPTGSRRPVSALNSGPVTRAGGTLAPPPGKTATVSRPIARRSSPRRRPARPDRKTG